MKGIPITVALCFGLFIASAQNMKIIELWPGSVPGETALKHEAKHAANSGEGDIIRLTAVTNPTLTVYKVADSLSNGAAVIICPGGGYQILAIDLEGYEIAEWLNSLGYTTFVLQYRVPQKQDGALQDVQRAIRIVRSMAESLSYDADKIGLLGFSAGSGLSARASTRYLDQTYPKEDLMDDLSARPDFAVLIYPAYLDLGANRSLTSELKVDSLTSPTFLFGTADDPYANSVLVYGGALRDKNVPVELHILPSGGHGYGLRKGNIAAETWPQLAEKWMSQFLR